jgi:N-alpha-acetyl-L-2,4-diaminobutyrate deacetylase
MSDTPTRVSCDIDFDRDGRQASFLAVANSVNESAYGTVTIPIYQFKNGDGPTIFLSGGVHGDEYEGQVALRKLAQSLDVAKIRGRVIVLPSMNLPAALAGKRLSPIDGLNLNRIFPGKADGSITETIAHYVSHVLLPLTDIQVDLHSGGTTLDYIPCIIMNEQPNDPERERKTHAALMAFGAPIALISKALDTTGLFEFECDARGILNLNAELGGAGMVRKHIVEIAERGIRNMLIHFGFMEGEVVPPEAIGHEPSRLMKIIDLDCFVMAPDEGLYEPFIELGDTVEAGQAIGQVHYLHHTDKAPWVLHTKAAGTLINKRPPGKVSRGDNVAIFATDAAYPEN